MNKILTRTALSLLLLPLAACGNEGKPAAAPAAQTAAVSGKAADKSVAESLKAKLEKTYESQGLKVISVGETPVGGLYEVVVSGKQIVYTDAAGNYMLVGDLIDINSQKSLTDERAAELNKIDFSSLPLDKAIKEVRGNGNLKIAVFSDPDCPFCRRLEAEFAKMTDVTIYTFMMPIASLHPDAARKAEIIWCQPDPTKAWTDWMRGGKMPQGEANCENPVAETTSLGEQLGFNGTPTLVFPNGRTQSGYSPMPMLQEIIEKNQ
ncbi:DsbC family protein [Neisseria animalis]|uniref:Thiol:disulfide interchange protein n=1 Tax=Neisseria animalis TaxID=492 RepID=A0A5P3MQ32_NEIAN|nr:DsbC family protein [Neisseria animalis]QEY23666.1 DsbC family protein [Neisseria animalis]ROW32911.1 DsbC family protein [Neisseria animalis]VEE09451.1 thiol:disulfide interchange protein [Neisseria animalis]